MGTRRLQRVESPGDLLGVSNTSETLEQKKTTNWSKQYFICTIRNMLNSIYAMKYMSVLENKLIAYINHLLQVMSSYEWYKLDKTCPVRKYYTYINVIGVTPPIRPRLAKKQTSAQPQRTKYLALCLGYHGV